DRPVGDGVGAVEHRLGLPIGRGDRARVEMVASDHDRTLHLSTADEVVEQPARAGALAIAEPADARGKALEVHALAGGFDPADQALVFRELLDDGAIGCRDVRRVARKRHPTKWSVAFAEKRPDVGGDEAWIIEGASAAAEPGFRAQAVAVVEDLGPAVEKLNHRVDVAGHALS